MKTTVEISDPLFRAAKKHCAERGISLRQLIEAGLRMAIEKPKQEARFRIRRFGFSGEGQVEHGWERIRELIYAGRGGAGVKGGETN